MRSLGIFACFNMLIFDPDTTVAALETNVDFMAASTDFPFNFCRTELYAGTPLLERMIREGRAHGDYLFHDYALRDPAVQRIFELSIEAFSPRNFGARAIHNSIGGWRLQLETVRHFHPEVYRQAWSTELEALQRRLGLDTVTGLRTIIDHVRTMDPSTDRALLSELVPGLRAIETEVRASWEALRARTVQGAGRDRLEPTVTDATPLQGATPRSREYEVSFVG